MWCPCLANLSLGAQAEDTALCFIVSRRPEFGCSGRGHSVVLQWISWALRGAGWMQHWLSRLRTHCCVVTGLIRHCSAKQRQQLLSEQWSLGLLVLVAGIRNVSGPMCWCVQHALPQVGCSGGMKWWQLKG